MSNNLPRPSRVAETFASGAALINAEYQSLYPALFPGYSTLQKCAKALQDIRALIDGISDHRRQKIQMAARRGTCLDMENLEMELDRCTSPIPDFSYFGSESEIYSGSPRITVLYAECMNSCLRFSGLS